MAGHVSQMVPDLVRGLGADKARVRFGCLKDLVRMSRTTPLPLYPYFDTFAALLDSENSIIRWNATRILANLAAVDRERKLDRILDKFLAPIRGHQMISAAVTIQSAATIAEAKPELADRIACGILKVRHARYQTDECRNVALGHAIRAFDQFWGSIRRKAPVKRLIAAQLQNSRSATRTKAEKFLRKYDRRVLGG
jgi:hypothetical protein